jgi:hypothetical protein
MARIMKDYGIIPLGIACEEYTAVCIDENGIAKVYGEYPSYEDYAYFIRPNCEIGFNEPETCNSGTPLTWNYNGQALKVYKVAGTANGDNTFNLLNWQSGNGGNWEVWSVNAGTFNSTTSSAISCALSVRAIQTVSSMNIYPNPANEFIVIENDNSQIQQIRISDVSGRVLIDKSVMQERQATIDVSNLQCGYYIIEIHTEKGISIAKLMKE